MGMQKAEGEAQLKAVRAGRAEGKSSGCDLVFAPDLAQDECREALDIQAHRSSLSAAPLWVKHFVWGSKEMLCANEAQQPFLHCPVLRRRDRGWSDLKKTLINHWEASAYFQWSRCYHCAQRREILW